MSTPTATCYDDDANLQNVKRNLTTDIDCDDSSLIKRTKIQKVEKLNEYTDKQSDSKVHPNVELPFEIENMLEEEEPDVKEIEAEETDLLQELPEKKYEYLDHTSDVQIHAWGETLEEAFEQCAMGMFAYMTDIESVNNISCEEILVEGEDLESLLFRFLDEFLYIFSAEPNFIARKVKILEFDRNAWKIRAKGYGETFDLHKHPQGTEVKAITYSNMQIVEEPGAIQVFVIIDI